MYVLITFIRNIPGAPKVHFFPPPSPWSTEPFHLEGDTKQEPQKFATVFTLEKRLIKQFSLHNQHWLADTAANFFQLVKSINTKTKAITQLLLDMIMGKGNFSFVLCLWFNVLLFSLFLDIKRLEFSREINEDIFRLRWVRLSNVPSQVMIRIYLQWSVYATNYQLHTTKALAANRMRR